MAKVLDSLTFPITRNGATTNETFVNNPLSTAGQFSASTAYSVGQYVYYDKKLYRFTTAHAAGAWNASHVTEVTVASELADLKEDTTELKQDFNEYHPDLGSGYSTQLLSTVFIEDEVPYNFRTSGGSADIGDREYDEIVGVSMPINQFYPNDVMHVTGTSALGWNSINSQPFNFSVITGHKYLFTFNGKTVSGGGIGVRDATEGVVFRPTPLSYAIIYGATVTSNGTTNVQGKWDAGTTDAYLNAFDLTLMLGTAIADYVYGLETATAGSGVTWLKHHFPKIFDSGYIPYNAGEMQSVSGLSAHRMTGFNQWDEQWELGTLNSSTGANVDANDRIRSKNFIPVIGGTQYVINKDYGLACAYDANKNYIGQMPWGYGSEVGTYYWNVPNGARYAKFVMTSTYGTTYKNDICIHLHWDGERDGQYEEYKEYEYALDDSVVLRGKLELDSNNNLRANGDRYLPDGTVERRFGVVDFGTLTWTHETLSDNRHAFKTSDLSALKSASGGNDVLPVVCAKYLPSFYNAPWVSGMISYATSSGSNIVVIDNNYSDATTFKTALSGVKLVYEKATPTTESASPYQTPQIVDDWGTEEYVSTSLVPVGHDTKYANNLRAKLEMSPDSPEEDGDYIVRHNNGENEYVALGSTTTIQGILDRLTALENA